MGEVRGAIYAEDEDGKRHVLAEARVSLEAVFNQFEPTEGLADDLNGLATDGRLPNFVHLHEVARAASVAFTPDLAAILMAVVLKEWERRGAVAATYARYTSFEELTGDSKRIELLEAWFEAGAALACYQVGDNTDRDDASRALTTLARLLVDRDIDTAVACSVSACSIAFGGAATVAAAEALTGVAHGHNEDASRLGLTYKVLGLYKVGPETAAEQVQIYDAFEAACRYPPDDDGREVCGEVLRRVANEVAYLRPLTFLWRCVFDPTSLGPDARHASKYGNAVWDVADSDLGDLLSQVNFVISEMEDRRLELLPDDDATAAVADLENWSIDHKAFRRAIPFSTSLMREANRDDILLTLSHEMIHIRSAQGALGINLLALRIAATECEIVQLSASGELGPIAEREGDPQFHLADIRQMTDPRALLLVEQQLELVRKFQLLRTIWLPWLEGIAVFGELSADPLLDPVNSTAFSDVVSSLNDATPGSVMAERGVSLEDASRIIRHEAEKLYAEALTGSGRARLRTYLDSGPERYLAGYLAARAVLSAWRGTHAFNGLSGYQGLIGATMAGTRFAVPDLSLSPSEFERQARGEMIAWLHRLSALDESSLSTLDAYTGWGWSREDTLDRVVERAEDLDAEEEQVISYLHDLVRAARTERSARADEFGDLDANHAALLGDVLDVVAQAAPEMNDELVQVLGEVLNDRMSLVPVGQVTAPFWLSLGGDVPRLAIGIRVTETDRERGKSSYSLLMVPLSTEQLGQLRTEMQALRNPRMEVRRFADVVEYSMNNDEGRGLGRNVIGLAYGDFTMVLAAGQFTGSPVSPSLEASVETRLRPPSVAELDALVAAGRSVAERAIAGLERADLDWGDPQLAADAEPWPQHVIKLAQAVLEDDDAQLVAEVSRDILHELGWDDRVFDAVCEDGLRAVYDTDFSTLTPLLEAILVSGRGVSEVELEGVPEVVRSLLFEATPHGFDLRAFRGDD